MTCRLDFNFRGHEMLTREQRATSGAKWLSHWQAWQSSGLPMAEYARREGFDADAAYRWRRILRRTGQWVEAEAVPAVKRKRRAQRVRFARVTLNAPPVAMVMRLMLSNGRRAELEFSSVGQIGDVIEALERAA